MKPKHEGGYSESHALLCERTLVTLLRGLGPWKESIFLAGGLVPRYLIRSAKPAGQPRHVGTSDVDLVLDMQILSKTEAYRSLQVNLKALGFERGTNDAGDRQHHSWWRAITPSVTVVVDLLCDAGSGTAGRLIGLPGQKSLSALHIPGSHLILSDFIEVTLQAELLDDRGTDTEIIRVAHIVPFLTLKALAYEDRFEEKDAYDLIYSLLYYGRGPEEVAELFAERMARLPDEPHLQQAVSILRNRFATQPEVRGQKDGPLSYASFLTKVDQPRLHSGLRLDAISAVDAFLLKLDSLIRQG